jgi:hypothetical protein
MGCRQPVLRGAYNVRRDGHQQAVEQLGAGLVRLEQLAPELAGLADFTVGAFGHDYKRAGSKVVI